MLKNQLNCVFGDPIEKDFKPLVYDQNRQNKNTMLKWPKVQKTTQEINRNSNIDNPRLLEMELKHSLVNENMNNVELGGFEVGFNRESIIQNETMTTTIERSYNEVPKFLISYSDIYQDNNSSHGCGLDDFENVEFNNKLLRSNNSNSSTTQQNYWVGNVLDQHFPVINSGNTFINSLSGTEAGSVLNNSSLVLEEDNGILDLLTQALNKTYLSDEKNDNLMMCSENVDNLCLNNNSNSISGELNIGIIKEKNKLISGKNDIDIYENNNENGMGKMSLVDNLNNSLEQSSIICGDTKNVDQHVLGIRIFTNTESMNKKKLSNIQLNTFDLINLCSQFGNILDICICNDGYYITYETRNSLEKALSSLENLQISAEGDFIHVFLHQTSNKMIGGIGRSMDLTKNQWDDGFISLNYSGIKDITSVNSSSDSLNLIDNMSILDNSNCGNTSTSFSSTLSASTGISTVRTPNSGLMIGNSVVRTSLGPGSPWNNYDNQQISSYENDLWTSLLNDGMNYNINDNIIFPDSCNKINIRQNKNQDYTQNNNIGLKIDMVNETEVKNNAKNTVKLDNRFNTINKSCENGRINKVNNAVTYSSVAGSNINKNNSMDFNLISHSGNVGQKVNKPSKLSIDKPNSKDNSSELLGTEKVQISTSVNSLMDSPSSSSSLLSSGSNNSNTQNSQPLLKKYTARYEIQIPPDNQFQIARRIIGTRGVNMKKIFKLTQSKLRLRGKGSGYLEGYNKQEADEPLHLCISSTDSEQYNNAKKLVEKLLLKIYQEYDDFLISNNEGHKLLNLQLKYKETMRTKQTGSSAGSNTNINQSKHK
ncbi:RRM domain and KH domain [Cryptosporidium xiaoi]|uniref:RRM domain and KH domain n=1 Tax=Cryptosporidium xiaoi TaxID=659607 RepID=A0AAV9XXX5_9CRYT